MHQRSVVLSWRDGKAGRFLFCVWGVLWEYVSHSGTASDVPPGANSAHKAIGTSITDGTVDDDGWTGRQVELYGNLVAAGIAAETAEIHVGDPATMWTTTS